MENNSAFSAALIDSIHYYIKASTYAKNEVEKAAYLDYYRTFYRNGGTLDGSNTSGSANVEQNNGANKDNNSDFGSVNVDGVEYKRYSKLILMINTYLMECQIKLEHVSEYLKQ